MFRERMRDKLSECCHLDKIFSCLLLLVVFFLFANTFGHTWTGDDFPVILENADIRSLPGFFANHYPGRPMRELTYLLDHALFGLNHNGFQFQNILWHGINAVLIYAVARKFCLGHFPSFLAGLLFLTHPLTVEVVANISHRKDSLALAFSLITILCLQMFYQGGRRKWVWGAFAMCGAIVAFFSKQTAVALIPMALVLNFVVAPQEKRMFGKHFKVVFVVAASIGITILVVIPWSGFVDILQEKYAEVGRTMLGKMNYFGPWDFTLYLLTVFKGWAFLFLRVAWPLDLGMEYTYALPTGWLDLWVVSGILIALGSLVAAGWAFRRLHLVVFWGIIWFWAFYLPTANLWPLAYFAADRYLYAPLAGLCLIVAWGLHRLPQRQTALVWIPAVILLLFFISLTWQQNRVWASPESLWTHSYQVSPSSSFALNNMGNIAYDEGRLRDAREYYQRALALNPYNLETHFNLGMLYERLGQPSLALARFRTFLQADNPKYQAEAQILRRHLDKYYPGWRSGLGKNSKVKQNE